MVLIGVNSWYPRCYPSPGILRASLKQLISSKVCVAVFNFPVPDHAPKLVDFISEEEQTLRFSPTTASGSILNPQYTFSSCFDGN